MTEATTRNSAARKSEGGVLELVWIILQALLIALVVRTLLFQPFNIPSGSLVPTLLVGDYLFVSKYSYGYSKYSLPLGPPPFDGRIMASEPKVGDIAVFKFPKDDKTDYIKRVIGLPGDKIRLIDARLYINDQECPRERLPDYKTIDAYGKETSSSSLHGDAAQRSEARNHPERRRYRLLEQHLGLYSAARSFLHDGR